MRYTLPALALLLICSSAQARTLEGTSNVLLRSLDRSFDLTSDTTTSTRDMKVVVAARDDAASFVASDGAIRGARLEAAFMQLRQQSTAARDASDSALAQAILAR